MNMAGQKNTGGQVWSIVLAGGEGERIKPTASLTPTPDFSAQMPAPIDRHRGGIGRPCAVN